MKRIDITRDIRPLTEFRSRMADMVKELNTANRPLFLTQHGRPVAVVLAPEDYAELMEKFEFVEAVKSGEASLDAGKGISRAKAVEQVRKARRK